MLASVAANERLTPYVKIDELSFGADDPYFDGSRTRIFAAGARFSLGPLAVFKAEILHVPQAGGAPSKTAMELRMGFGW